MKTTLSLQNHFLIAMPNLTDEKFFHSVTYVCEHNEEGAMGIIINQPMQITVKDLLEHMDITTSLESLMRQPVLSGGPIQQERGFVIHRADQQHWQSTLHTSDDLAITTSRDVLIAIANDKGPKEHRVALGYAGWGAGQLEAEMANNAWLSGPADPALVFDLPYPNRWRAAAKLAGIDIDRLTFDVGHA